MKKPNFLRHRARNWVLLSACVTGLFLFTMLSCQKVSETPDSTTTFKEVLRNKTNGVDCNQYGFWRYSPEWSESEHKWVWDWHYETATYCIESPTTIGGSAGNSNTASGPWSSGTTIFSSVSGTVITNMATYLSCFDTTSSAAITLYVQQPEAGYDQVWTASPDVNVGEVFVKIVQGSVTKVFGFYPSGGLSPLTSTSTTGAFIDKSGGYFNVSLMYGVSTQDFKNVLYFLRNYATIRGGTYDFNYNNNVDFLVDVANSSGLPLYVADGEFPNSLGWAKSAGYLGQVLRYTGTMSMLLNESGGAAPNSDSCP